MRHLFAVLIVLLPAVVFAETALTFKIEMDLADQAGNLITASAESSIPICGELDRANAEKIIEALTVAVIELVVRDLVVSREEAFKFESSKPQGELAEAFRAAGLCLAFRVEGTLRPKRQEHT